MISHEWWWVLSIIRNIVRLQKITSTPHTWMQTFAVLSICLMLDTGLPNTPSHDPSLHPNTQSAKLPVKLKPHHNYGKILALMLLFEHCVILHRSLWHEPTFYTIIGKAKVSRLPSKLPSESGELSLQFTGLNFFFFFFFM